MKNDFDIIGVGSPIVDLLAPVSEELIKKIPGEKGGMALVSSAEMDSLLKIVNGIKVAPGGSSANTIFASARLGLKASFLGKLGNDRNGSFYKESFEIVNGDLSKFKYSSELPTARCLSLITPDAERTMRTDLGASGSLSVEDIRADDFMGVSHAHLEGYTLFNRPLLMKILESAKSSGCSISMDMGSFEVVKSAMDVLPEIMGKYVDIVFANEDEASAYSGKSDPFSGLDELSKKCRVAVVKTGKKGSLVKKDGKVYAIAPVIVENPVDTTAAGDFYAAGFLYGLINGKSPDICGKMGSILGAYCVQHMGTDIPEPVWSQIKTEVNSL